MRVLGAAGIILAAACPPYAGAVGEDVSPTPPAAAASKDPPERVEVLPVLFVPQGQPPFTPAQTETVMRHVRWAQAR